MVSRKASIAVRRHKLVEWKIYFSLLPPGLKLNYALHCFPINERRGASCHISYVFHAICQNEFWCKKIDANPEMDPRLTLSFVVYSIIKKRILSRIFSYFIGFYMPFSWIFRLYPTSQIQWKTTFFHKYNFTPTISTHTFYLPLSFPFLNQQPLSAALLILLFQNRINHETSPCHPCPHADSGINDAHTA